MPLHNAFNGFRQELERELLGNILPFHIDHLIDHQRGGFYGSISNDLQVDLSADRSIVQCSRILWAYSRAYRIYQQDDYKRIAKHAFDFLLEYFWDGQFGGFYWHVDVAGTPKDDSKFTYGQEFGIYALVEYYLATEERSSLEKAIELFNLIEQRALLEQGQGYRDVCNRDWSDDPSCNVDEVDYPGVLTMNSHLHLMEAYTALLLAWQNDLLKERLHNLILLTHQRIYDQNSHHLNLFFDRNWVPYPSSISYGHDIEASWLLWEAAEALGDDELIVTVRPTVIDLAEATLQEAYDHQEGGIFDERKPDGELVDLKGWWAQAEAMVGFYNAYQITNEERYLDAALKTWQFIRARIIDHQNGEWFWGIDSQGNVLNGEKAGAWKTPYHNGRACMELLQRLSD